MLKTIIQPSDQAKPQAPYSLATRAGDTLYLAGIVAIDQNGQLVGEGDIRQQTRKVLENVESILRAGGSSLERTLKTTVYLTDFTNYAGMNEVYAEFFRSDPPARATVRADLVRQEFLVEIDAIAIVD